MLCKTVCCHRKSVSMYDTRLSSRHWIHNYLSCFKVNHHESSYMTNCVAKTVDQNAVWPSVHKTNIVSSGKEPFNSIYIRPTPSVFQYKVSKNRAIYILLIATVWALHTHNARFTLQGQSRSSQGQVKYSSPCAGVSI